MLAMDQSSNQIDQIKSIRPNRAPNRSIRSMRSAQCFAAIQSAPAGGGVGEQRGPARQPEARLPQRPRQVVERRRPPGFLREEGASHSSEGEGSINWFDWSNWLIISIDWIYWLNRFIESIHWTNWSFIDWFDWSNWIDGLNWMIVFDWSNQLIGKSDCLNRFNPTERLIKSIDSIDWLNRFDESIDL